MLTWPLLLETPCTLSVSSSSRLTSRRARIRPPIRDRYCCRHSTACASQEQERLQLEIVCLSTYHLINAKHTDQQEPATVRSAGNTQVMLAALEPQ